MKNNIDNLLEIVKKYECKNCGCNLFIPGYFLLEIPASVSETGTSGMGPTLVTFLCSECGEVFQNEEHNEN